MADEIPTAVEESNALFIAVWRRFAESFTDAEVESAHGLEICWADVPFPAYNMIFLTAGVEDPAIVADRVGAAASYVRKKRNAGFITVCHDLLSGDARSDIDAIMARERCVPVLPLTGMAGNLLPLAMPGHAGVRIERCADDGVVVTEINCAAYGFSPDDARGSLARASLWKDAFPYMALEGSRPVATATTFVHRACLYLALVATLPDARRKGYAEAVVRHSLQKAHEATGLTRTVLHATTAGYSLYERLGYRSNSQFTWYTYRAPE